MKVKLPNESPAGTSPQSNILRSRSLCFPVYAAGTGKHFPSCIQRGSDLGGKLEPFLLGNMMRPPVFSGTHCQSRMRSQRQLESLRHWTATIGTPTQAHIADPPPWVTDIPSPFQPLPASPHSLLHFHFDSSSSLGSRTLALPPEMQ